MTGDWQATLRRLRESVAEGLGHPPPLPPSDILIAQLREALGLSVEMGNPLEAWKEAISEVRRLRR